ncbi:FadR/GntR family transcriptional regulator [Actinomadura rugatobispora]|uniref:FadR/GntR family transcriptional regulator n=1 Tax=Actinomadura rugatobispora TaxID=1994 RepID=A0ABW1AFC5_9ACTN|nr:GntR family transcriptional regulator [Actinomadura rugatobispora]
MVSPPPSSRAPRRGRPRQLRLAEQVAGKLRARILAADLEAGSLLPKQDELVAEFGVSYPSVREALRILENEGLITVRRGSVGGAEIHAPGASSAGYALGLALQAARVKVSDLGDAITMLEPLSTACCAMRPDRGEVVVPVLRELLAEAERQVDDAAEFTRASRRFHQVLSSFNDNQTLQLVLRGLGSLWAAQEETWELTLTDALNEAGDYLSLDERREVLSAHGRITGAIERGDPDEAERLSREHLRSWHWEMQPGVQGQVVDAASSKLRARYRAQE